MGIAITQLDQILEDNIELIKLSRSGIAFQLFEDIVGTGLFSREDWVNYLHLSEKNLQDYENVHGTFKPMQSERILEIARLQKRGIDVFGDTENFKIWMNTESIALGNIKPKDFLDSSFGIQMIEDELIRIEQGVLA